MIPLVLVEEVLVNRGQPGPIPGRVVDSMFSDLLLLTEFWVDSEENWIFVELVEKNPSTLFKAMLLILSSERASFHPKAATIRNS